MQDTFKRALKGIISKLLDSDLLVPYQVRDLENQLAALTDSRNRESISLSLKGFDTNFSIDINNPLRWYESELISDENGDEYAPAKVRVEVSYPSHGGCSLEVLEHRLNFFVKAMNLCKEIEAEYSGEYVTLVRTGAEKRAKAEKLQQEIRSQKLLNFQLSLQKNMRVGHCKSAPTSEIPDGTYQLGGDKTYRLQVISGLGHLTRLT